MELLEKLKDNNVKKEFEAKVKEKTNMPLAQAISLTASEFGYETSPEELEKIFKKGKEDKKHGSCVGTEQL